MVTKRAAGILLSVLCLILAKIHMVTKHNVHVNDDIVGLILAKIHMVTKLCGGTVARNSRSYSSKNLYGNKTQLMYKGGKTEVLF